MPIRRLFAIVVLTSCSFASSSEQALSVDTVIANFVGAIGGQDNLDRLDNLVYRNGLYEEGEYTGEGDAAMSVARPWFKLVGDKDRPGGYMEGYDGSAWEWFESPGVVIRTVGPASEAIRHYAGVEHPLIDYADKGSAARLLGETELDGRSVAVIELVRRDGFVEQFYIDTATWLIIASGGAAPIHAFGDSVQRLTRIGDYREVAGVLVAHRFVSLQMPSGEPLSSMQWGEIEANVDLPPHWFSPPEFERSALQSLIEILYQQRDDREAVLWTYHEFRRAWPDVDISGAINVAGFQILKMGTHDTAITLLQRNTEAYPECGDCFFGLGRAYNTAGDLGRARTAWLKALEVDPDHARSKRALEDFKQP